MLLFCPASTSKAASISPSAASSHASETAVGDASGPGSQLFENRACLVASTRRRERPAQDADKERRPVRHRDPMLACRDAFLGSSQCYVRDAQRANGRRVLLLEGERVLDVAQAFLRLSAHEQSPAGEGVGKRRERIGFARALEERQRLVEPLARAQRDRERAQREDVIGLQLERPAPGRLHRLPPALEEGGERFGMKTVRRLSLQLLRRRQHFPRGRAGGARRDHAHVRREHGDLREAGPRRRVSGIEADGFFERAIAPPKSSTPRRCRPLR